MANTPTQAKQRRPGVYLRGTETVNAILKAAMRVLVEEGASAFTLQRIAAECGLKVGHVNYHFPRKELIIQVLLEDLIAAGESQVEGVIRGPDLSPEDALAALITHILDDVSTKQTANLFTELWAMSNHNDFVAARLEEMNRYVHRIISDLVLKLNPSLSPEDASAVAIFIYGAADGMTIFSGYGRPWSSSMPKVKAVAVKALIDLAKTVTPSEISTLPVSVE
jgi:AcrR family transcriptional regulator